jgi:SAM-dependent methyltransferase
MSADLHLKPLDAEFADAERFVDSLLPQKGVLKVLDIKAGEQRFEVRRPVYVVGVDVVQAERGRRADADEHRVMDLERVELEEEQYDVVLCVNVLEHAREPMALFEQVRGALKSGGTFVVVSPNVASVKSFIARLTPWSVHRWFYERVLRSEGLPARSIHSFSLRPARLLSYAPSRGWKVEYFRAYEGPVQQRVRRRFGLVGWRWKVFVTVTRLMTLGLLSAEDTGIVAVFTKTPLS